MASRRPGRGGKRPVLGYDDVDEDLKEIVPQPQERRYLRNPCLWYLAIITFILGVGLLFMHFSSSSLSGPEYVMSFRAGSILTFLSTVSILYLAEEVDRNPPEEPIRICLYKKPPRKHNRRR